MIKPGDIILIKTKYCPFSWLIRKGSKSNYNHAVLVGYKNILLDCRGHRFELNKIDKYFDKRRYETKILRFEKFTEQDIYNILSSANPLIFRLKKGYGRFLLTLLLLLFKYKGELPKLTCSAFIALAFEFAGFYIDIGKDASRITPEDINQRRGTKEVSNEL